MSDGIDTKGNPRKGSWVQTFLGIQFWPLDPRPEEIEIEDIAHALAHQCRFGGMCREHYSVAEHSVRASYLVPPEDALWALMHDASEAYCQDIVRPLKKDLVGYQEIEDRIQLAICSRFGLALPMPASVKRADEIMLTTEKRDLTGPAPAPWTFAQGVVVEPLEDVIYPWSAGLAKEDFLRRFDELGGKR